LGTGYVKASQRSPLGFGPKEKAVVKRLISFWKIQEEKKRIRAVKPAPLFWGEGQGKKAGEGGGKCVNALIDRKREY